MLKENKDIHAFITLHIYYHGSPPPGICPQRFGSWLFYYGSSTFPVLRAYNSPQNGSDLYEANWIAPGSSACDLILRSSFSPLFLAQQLTKMVHTVLHNASTHTYQGWNNIQAELIQKNSNLYKTTNLLQVRVLVDALISDLIPVAQILGKITQELRQRHCVHL
jgi:hypothetical protein